MLDKIESIPGKNNYYYTFPIRPTLFRASVLVVLGIWYCAPAVTVSIIAAASGISRFTVKVLLHRQCQAGSPREFLHLHRFPFAPSHNRSCELNVSVLEKTPCLVVHRSAT